MSSIDAGLRWNETSVLNDSVTGTTNFTNVTSSFFRPSGDRFSSLMIAGPNNFNAAYDRRLYFSDFLIIDGARAFRDPAGTLAELNAAIAASNTANGSIAESRGSNPRGAPRPADVETKGDLVFAPAGESVSVLADRESARPQGRQQRAGLRGALLF